MKKRNRILAALLSAAMLASCAGGFALPAAVHAEEVQTQTSAAQAKDSSGVIFANSRTDFRDESIYFVMTSRFYDGDSGNNVQCWDGTQYNDATDPPWRGDFKGLTEKLDYIKALGFTAIWITPVVENASGYDYHGYHAIDFSEVDPRYASDGESGEEAYKKFIEAAHAKGLKVIQDVVFNHTGNFGEENLFPMFEKEGDLSSTDSLKKIGEGEKLPENYDDLTPGEQYSARLNLMKNSDGENHDVNNIYHHEKSMSWESYTCQTGQIAGDCVDLNTENPLVYKYLQDCYKQYIDWGVDAFRVDTTKHVSRLTFNNALIQPFYEEAKKNGNDSFYMFGEVCTRVREVWNKGIPAISSPFYTWKESKNYAWSDTDTSVNEASTLQNYNDNIDIGAQPTSDNALLKGNNYHEPDYSQNSGLGVIDFPMHWNFTYANDAFRVAVENDQTYNDATWNVTYVDSHDYAPDGAPENTRFNQPQDTWAENLSLMFTFRGIPCIYYGSEIEFQKGEAIDVGPNKALADTGRAYFGDYIEGDVQTTDFGEYSGASGAVRNTLNHPLSLHIQRLNKIRQAVPALRKGQYSVQDISGNQMAFKRRYTDGETDSFALVTVSGDATFSNIPNGTYVDCITGDTKNVSNGTLTANCSGKGNLRVYVLNTNKTPAPGKVGQDGTYLYTNGPVNPPEIPPVEEVQVQDVNLSPKTMDLTFGSVQNNTGKITAEVLPANATDKKLSWSSSDPAVATVNNGIVTAAGKGTAVITAEAKNGVKEQVTVKVTEIPYDYEAVPEGHTAIYFQKPEGWGSSVKAYLYYGDSTTISGAWPGSTMERLPNGVYRYVYETPEGQNVKVLFNDGGSNQAPGSIGFDVVSYGKYDKNGLNEVIVPVKPDEPEELQLTGISVDLKSPQKAGTTVKMTAQAAGGVGELQYRFYRVKDGKTTVFRDFGTGSTAYCNPAAGDYVIFVDVKDEAGHLKTKTIEYSWNSDLKVTEFISNVESPQPAGATIKLTAEAQGGVGDLQYRFYRVANGKTTVFRDYQKGNTAYCNPAAEGAFKICVDVKDAAGNVKTESMDYVWNDSLTIESFTADLQSPQKAGTTIKLTAKALGGQGKLQYRFYRVSNGKTTVFRAYNSSNTAYCNPAQKGTCKIYVDAKDERGQVVTYAINYQWN